LPRDYLQTFTSPDICLLVKVLIVGANGKVGTILSGKMWAANGFSPIALIRDARQQTKFTALGVPSAVGDLEEGLLEFLPGLDTVVFTAGSGARTGPDKTIDVDQNASIRLMDDCKQAGVQRFVMVSAIGADPLSNSPLIQNYLRAKGTADEHLRSSGLGYTILAPGTLLNEAATGRIQAAEELGCHGTLPREDLAQSIIEVLGNYNTIGKTIQVISGKDPIKSALANASGGEALPPIL
jgi:uncharacterized protein YbjT (DUF2867 family)